MGHWDTGVNAIDLDLDNAIGFAVARADQASDIEQVSPNEILLVALGYANGGADVVDPGFDSLVRSSATSIYQVVFVVSDEPLPRKGSRTTARRRTAPSIYMEGRSLESPVGVNLVLRMDCEYRQVRPEAEVRRAEVPNTDGLSLGQSVALVRLMLRWGGHFESLSRGEQEIGRG